MSQNNPVQTIITSKLKLGIDCDYLDVVNESYMHNVPPGSESHFKVTVVSKAFDGMRLIGRHRMINQILSEELQNQIHALAIHTYTVEEWNEKTSSPESPKCMGGSKLG